jgi:hypothetical protein
MLQIAGHTPMPTQEGGNPVPNPIACAPPSMNSERSGNSQSQSFNNNESNSSM